MIKLGVIGDCHIGANVNLGWQDPTLNINTRILDYVETLELTIDDMVAQGVTELVFTGDIFEHRYPSIVQQKLFSKSLHRALSKGVSRIHIVVGNHDQQRVHTTTTLSYLKELNLSNIVVYDDLTLTKLEYFGRPVANLILMPYRDRLWMDADTHEVAVEKLQAELEAQLEKRDPTLPTVLVGHMVVEGTFISEADSDLYSENQLTLPHSMFEGIGLTLMGHVHKPEVMSEDPYIAYVGSMEKRGGFEDHNKVYAVVDLADASVVFHKEPCRDIFDIDMDFSSTIFGADLMFKIKQFIDAFAQNHILTGSILRPSVKICFEDDAHLDGKSLIAYVKENHGVNYCANIKKDILSARQSRDERITEDTSHLHAFKMFLETSIDDTRLRELLLEAGQEIIRATGEGNASNQIRAE